jgi:hypothetical protein
MMNGAWSTEFAMKPRLSCSPIAQDCIGSNLEHLGGFLDAETAKKPEFHNAALSGI